MKTVIPVILFIFRLWYNKQSSSNMAGLCEESKFYKPCVLAYVATAEILLLHGYFKSVFECNFK